MQLSFPKKCSAAERKVLIYQTNKQFGRELYNACLVSADVDYETKNKLNTSICTLFAKRLIAETLENTPSEHDYVFEVNDNHILSLSDIVNSLNKEQYAKLNSTAIQLQLEDDKKYEHTPSQPYFG